MRAHKTQIAVDGPFFALLEQRRPARLRLEHYVLARGERGPGDRRAGLGGRPVRGLPA
jgi:N-acetyl-1-D-myo-inositol-2-amino-2-deoxy-alpha-D-glucopyranoside deacetylase